MFIYSVQSSDLNSIETIWNILKQRVRRRRWDDLEQLKEILQDEWSKISMKEIRVRIAEMSSRYRTLTNLDEKVIRSSL